MVGQAVLALACFHAPHHRCPGHVAQLGSRAMRGCAAQVWLQAGTGNVRINRMPLDVAFPTFDRRIDVLAPFRVSPRAFL